MPLTTPMKMLLLFSGGAYSAAVLATSPIAYWKLDEGTGTTITDSSGNGLDGTYSGVTWDGTNFVKGGAVPFWDGANDYGDIYSAGLSSAFDLDEFTILVWLKVSGSGVWTDGATRTFFRLRYGASDQLFMEKTTTSNQFSLRRVGAGTTDTITIGSLSTTDWFSVMLSGSVSGDLLRARIDGTISGSDQTGLLAHTGVSMDTNNQVIGSTNVTPLNVWDGYISNVVVWDSAESADKIALAS